MADDHADPLLYDQLIRRFQSAAEREAEGRQKGYSGVLEGDLRRSEAKMAALANSQASSVTYRRGSHGEIYAEDSTDAPENQEDGIQRWRREMTERFLRGEDVDFDYQTVDDNEEWDDRVQQERDEEDRWFATEEPCWIIDEAADETGRNPSRGESDVRLQAQGETGVQDF